MLGFKMTGIFVFHVEGGRSNLGRGGLAIALRMVMRPGGS